MNDAWLGIVALLIGLALIVGSGHVTRSWAKKREEDPQWVRDLGAPDTERSERLTRWFNRVWLIVVGAVFCWMGVSFLSRGL